VKSNSKDSQPRPGIVWFRLDLRLADNPALTAAISRGGPVVPLFIWAPEEEGAWSPGGASQWILVKNPSWQIAVWGP